MMDAIQEKVAKETKNKGLPAQLILQFEKLRKFNQKTKLLELELEKLQVQMKELTRKIKQGNSNTDKIIANACGTKLKIRIMMIELSPKTPEDETEYSSLMYTIQHPEEFQLVRDEMVVSPDSEKVG